LVIVAEAGWTAVERLSGFIDDQINSKPDKHASWQNVGSG
jgi:hypothetical protein